ncbi:hypothetical protein [Mariprofundus ferrooxydans]|uniref:hypothetical protein n=1 Tax=Mariprofundus ferrooxydans TaxID=314344 RepID=UPI0006815248|nr:hypothetical protein [Mariprofundus ferrooxydans]KON48917.1 hypothetical protein AL013_00870 [Mariprofundus ferrooxydans]
MRSAINILRVTLVGLILAGFVQPASAFIAWQNDGKQLELRGLLRGSGVMIKNPDNRFFYNKQSLAGVAGSGRLMLDAGFGDHVTVEVHAEQNYIPLTLQSGGSNLATLRDVERSDLLDWSFDSRRSHLLIDRLNLQYSAGKVNVKIGRQPLNLAATFYFTPNDFFAPFAAQTFFRAYKPGVDAVRMDIQLAELSQLSLISVLGYRTDPFADNGWSNRVDAARNAYLVRKSAVYGDFEWAVLAGSVKRDGVVGGDFQGELFEWLGVRGEGHLLIPDQPGQKRRLELSVGLEHRWENSLTLRAEQFYHGGGATAVAAYNTAAQGYYMARQYSALGASYEFTPLLNGDATLLYNWVDHSALLALYALYSLSDESELAVSATVARGARPTAGRINSEFGLYGTALSCELRSYF